MKLSIKLLHDDNQEVEDNLTVGEIGYIDYGMYIQAVIFN